MRKERGKGPGQERWEGEEGGGAQTVPREKGEREKRSKRGELQREEEVKRSNRGE